jgi:predicted transcriptional regulator
MTEIKQEREPGTFSMSLDKKTKAKFDEVCKVEDRQPNLVLERFMRNYVRSKKKPLEAVANGSENI